MSLESERFLEPVFREFYKEKEVILEERRMRTDNSPIGKTIEAFLDTAYTKHPYKRPVIGYPEDIRNLTRQDVQDFFETHYSPNNLTVAIVGDVDTSEVRKLAQVYFGRFQTKSKTTASIPEEPPQTTTKEVTLKLQSEPWYLEGYHRPSINDRDDVVYEAIAALLSDGRSSRLYKSLVEEKQVALSAEGINSFPGDKYPNLILFYALTAPDRTVEDVAKALEIELDRLKTQPVKPEELERFKTQAKAGLLRTLDSNMGMARLLAEYQAKTGSWRNLFEKIAAIDKVTVADVQRVALSTFTPENRTIGRLINND
jgi:predicted Zn-dependent peptidase